MSACNIDESAPICFVDDNKYNIQDVKNTCQIAIQSISKEVMEREEHFQEVLTFAMYRLS